jgi:leucyl-tRNA synthetase
MATNCENYDFQKIEPFWQTKWLAEKTFCVANGSPGKKYYALDMFPYPSGAGLHIGHPEGYTASDILVRYKWANGFNVLHPMGWDAFGLPAEQHAIATGQHPSINTEKNIQRFREQIQSLGFAIDWDREVDTTDPTYFRWTQWIFLKLFKHGLAYVDNKPVWWCPELKSVLANEEVIGGRSERGNFPVERKNLRQWVLRITRYADKLLEGLEDIDWPDSTKRQQIAWIGRSDGVELDFEIAPGGPKIRVYTTRPDTIFGATFLVLAPEHEFVERVTTAENRKKVQEYANDAKKKSDLERTDLAKDKSGVFTGGFAINPLNGESIPIWIADYVLVSYGTGAIMAVPAHDERDFEFARKFDIPIRQVVASSEFLAQFPQKKDEEIFHDFGKNRDPLSSGESHRDEVSGQNSKGEFYGGLPFCGDGILINSGEFDGLTTEEAGQKIAQKAKRFDFGRRAVKYKLRDWLFSRQRYWGEPIPILWIERSHYDRALAEKNAYFGDGIPDDVVSYEKNGVEWCAIPIAETQLPLTLPETEIYLPSDDGESPLAHAKRWLNVFVNLLTGEISAEFRTGFVPAIRETNTMPQWAGSCWYYLRYMSPDCETNLVDPQAEAYWNSPDFYIGGAEHAVLHLLYARFWHLFLYDIGVVSAAKEPFRRLFHQGIILGGDGNKMSKSRGNVVNPDEVIRQYGADSLRLYEMFLGPLDAMKPWNTKGIEGVYRFLKKVWIICIDADGQIKTPLTRDSPEIDVLLHETIKKVTEDVEALQFNTAIAQMMIFINNAQKTEISREKMTIFLQLLAPFAPHISEELWARLGESFSISKAKWPAYDPLKLVTNQVKIILQVNGKVRDEILVNRDATPEIVEKIAWQQSRFMAFLSGKEIIRKIYIPGKFLNVVVRSWLWEIEGFEKISRSVPLDLPVSDLCLRTNRMLPRFGKVRDEILVNRDATPEIVEKIAWQQSRFLAFLSGKEIIRKIYIPGKILNVVVRSWLWEIEGFEKIPRSRAVGTPGVAMLAYKSNASAI